MTATTESLWLRAAVRNIASTTAEADALAAHRKRRHAPKLWPLALCVALIGLVAAVGGA